MINRYKLFEWQKVTKTIGVAIPPIPQNAFDIDGLQIQNLEYIDTIG